MSHRTRAPGLSSLAKSKSIELKSSSSQQRKVIFQHHLNVKTLTWAHAFWTITHWNDFREAISVTLSSLGNNHGRARDREEVKQKGVEEQKQCGRENTDQDCRGKRTERSAMGEKQTWEEEEGKSFSFGQNVFVEGESELTSLSLLLQQARKIYLLQQQKPH